MALFKLFPSSILFIRFIDKIIKLTNIEGNVGNVEVGEIITTETFLGINSFKLAGGVCNVDNVDFDVDKTMMEKQYCR